VVVSYLIQRILWVDCIGAIATGVAIFIFSGWLSSLSGFSREFVIGHAFVHLIYGAYSLSLAVRKRRPMLMLMVLIFANAAWGCFCLIFAATLWGDAPVFAVAQFTLEGLYVGGLALIEWKRRDLLQDNN
jgi:hypothetical protein